VQALRAQKAGLLEARLHRNCDSSSCKLGCIEAIRVNVALYLQELSRVFFKKENLRNKRSWWLSTFYSFCIQSAVRKALIALARDAPADLRGESSIYAKHYLYLPIRLFIASSGSYDPVNSRDDWHSADTNDGHDIPTEEDYKQARLVVQFEEWASHGVSGSADHLRRIFEDTGDGVEVSQPCPEDNDPLKRYPGLWPGVWCDTRKKNLSGVAPQLSA
jgi:hypothetical protein